MQAGGGKAGRVVPAVTEQGRGMGTGQAGGLRSGELERGAAERAGALAVADRAQPGSDGGSAPRS